MPSPVATYMTAKTTRSLQPSSWAHTCQATTPSARNGTIVTVPVRSRSSVSFAHGSTSSRPGRPARSLTSPCWCVTAKPALRSFDERSAGGVVGPPEPTVLRDADRAKGRAGRDGSEPGAAAAEPAAARAVLSRAPDRAPAPRERRDPHREAALGQPAQVDDRPPRPAAENTRHAAQPHRDGHDRRLEAPAQPDVE